MVWGNIGGWEWGGGVGGWRGDDFTGGGKLESQAELCLTIVQRPKVEIGRSALLPKVCHL
jgi:hypothetical protein